MYLEGQWGGGMEEGERAKDWGLSPRPAEWGCSQCENVGEVAGLGVQKAQRTHFTGLFERFSCGDSRASLWLIRMQ